ncbi:hypothetical protein NQD34_013389 [Periophthalmus magnuspinnatus]|nr:hypothetical protein NQD34_013389 [Periophthalmus magnuspinnatus]
MWLSASALVFYAILLQCCGRLIVHPDRSWFFRNEFVSFRCSGRPDQSRGPKGRTGVLRNTSSPDMASCESGWGTVNGDNCTIEGVFTLDSGHYWCETKQSLPSDPIGVTVTSDRVLLSVPAHPALQGALVSLACLYKESTKQPATSEFNGRFFRNGEFIENLFPAILTLSSVTLEDDGVYQCEHPTRGRSRGVQLKVSPQLQHTDPTATSWMTETPPPSPPRPITIPLYRILCFVLLFLLYTSILCISLCVCCRLSKARAKVKRRGTNL